MPLKTKEAETIERTPEDLIRLEAQNKEFLFLSKEEFDTYKRNGNLNKFRQAGNKLFCLAENILEIKTSKVFGAYEQFARELRRSNAIPFETKEDESQFLGNLKLLHLLFYHGIESDMEIESLEDIYRKVYAKLEEVV